MMKKHFSKQVLFYSSVLFIVVLLINFTFLFWMHHKAESNKFDLLTRQLGAAMRPHIASQIEVAIRSQLKNLLKEPSILAIEINTENFTIKEGKESVIFRDEGLFSNYLWTKSIFPIYKNSDQEFSIKVAYENSLARKTLFDALGLSALFLLLLGCVYWLLVSRIVSKETLEIEKSNMAKRIFHVLKSEFIPLINLEDERHFQKFSNQKKRLMRLSFYQRILGSISKFITFEGNEYYSLEKYQTVALRPFLEELAEAKKLEYIDKSEVLLTVAQSNNETLVKIIPSEFWQALSNLLNNAYEAIAGKGEIAVTINDIDKDLVEISIEDNGKGIPEDELGKIFEEGYSYEKDKGNGIGLPQAMSKIRALGGEITVKSRLGIGTKVSITLIKENDSGRATSKVDLILVDDALNRRINAQELAKDNGYSMLSFENYDSCIEFLQENPLESSVPIFGDSEMCDGKAKGEFRSRELYEMGYKNITIVTGAEDSEIDKIKSYPWIKKVIAKESMGSDYTEFIHEKTK